MILSNIFVHLFHSPCYITSLFFLDNYAYIAELLKDNLIYVDFLQKKKDIVLLVICTSDFSVGLLCCDRSL